MFNCFRIHSEFLTLTPAVSIHKREKDLTNSTGEARGGVHEPLGSWLDIVYLPPPLTFALTDPDGLTNKSRWYPPTSGPANRGGACPSLISAGYRPALTLRHGPGHPLPPLFRFTQSSTLREETVYEETVYEETVYHNFKITACYGILTRPQAQETSETNPAKSPIIDVLPQESIE
ncbi:hypothetical protein B0H14DRAFT_2565560 [Mycena olivaceomarginata]|nr:hypothetical protein B0H14DRAFT_2565560 [Mycena olivaceomarginata]